MFYFIIVNKNTTSLSLLVGTLAHFCTAGSVQSKFDQSHGSSVFVWRSKSACVSIYTVSPDVPIIGCVCVFSHIVSACE